MVKLKLYHFSETSITLFESYLSNRKQLVKFGNTVSNVLPVISGVPEGSILGPLLFLLYANEIPCCVEHKNIDMYADDTTLYACETTVESIQSKLQADLKNVNDWCTRYNMVINPTKSTCMVIKSKKKYCAELLHKINNTLIQNVKVLSC